MRRQSSEDRGLEDRRQVSLRRFMPEWERGNRALGFRGLSFRGRRFEKTDEFAALCAEMKKGKPSARFFCLLSSRIPVL
ncbi:MAG: hypothetical protein LBD06_06835 [Candidatus Accumulibacter sp.]|nr:hypothetical protein [Accumulibacter sp.]